MELYKKLIKKPIIIAGPCVLESEDINMQIASKISELCGKYNIDIIFKASFDKANRTSLLSHRGPGIERGLRMLEKIKKEFGLLLVTDIHESNQAKPVGEVVDIIQIPAFLCRQTDLLIAASKTGKIVNIKKAQFLSGKDMYYPCKKVKDTGNRKILVTERGNSFGYNNLVVDFRNIADMNEFGFPVIMDCTHSVQRPGGGNGITTGNREFVISMAMAAKAFGAGGYFIETHPDPNRGLSDAANMLELHKLEPLICKVLEIEEYI